MRAAQLIRGIVDSRCIPPLIVEGVPEIRLHALVQVLAGCSSTLNLRTAGIQCDSNLVPHFDKARGLRGSHLSRMPLDEPSHLTHTSSCSKRQI